MTDWARRAESEAMESQLEQIKTDNEIHMNSLKQAQAEIGELQKKLDVQVTVNRTLLTALTVAETHGVLLKKNFAEIEALVEQSKADIKQAAKLLSHTQKVICLVDCKAGDHDPLCLRLLEFLGKSD